MADIKAVVFDVYGTLFDVESIQKDCEEHFPGKGEAVSSLWRSKQLEYAFLRQLMGQYEPFNIVTKDSLSYALEIHECSYTDEVIQELMNAYNQLSPFEETEGILRHFQGKKLAVFSNGPDEMLDPLLRNAGFRHFFDAVVSVDGVKQYKPTTASYAYLVKQLHVRREKVLFVSSNGWDIAGAANFGFRTAWINRKGAPADRLGHKPDKEYSNLNGLMEENNL